jgi:SnoaL-like domain
MANQANAELVKELLDIMTNDSENLQRTLKCLTDDCVWVMEPGGTEYHGIKEIKAFVGIAMSGRTHDKSRHRIEITNWFADNQNLCVEYTHGAVLTGKLTAGVRARIKAGISRYCITYHIRDGKFDRVHEYINATSWSLNALAPLALSYLRRLTTKQVAKAAILRKAIAQASSRPAITAMRGPDVPSSRAHQAPSIVVRSL